MESLYGKAGAAGGLVEAVCPRSVDIRGAGPRAASRMLAGDLDGPQAKQDWLERARVAAIIGSAPRSIEHVRSGLRAWLNFHNDFLGSDDLAFPPRLEHLQAWSRTFTCPGTFTNYLGHVKMGFHLVKCC